MKSAAAKIFVIFLLFVMPVCAAGIFAQSKATRIKRSDLPKNPPKIEADTVVQLIKIKSKQAEYEYVRYACRGCKIKRHIMTMHRGVPCDILVLTDEDGNEQRYYFDISLFYRK